MPDSALAPTTSNLPEFSVSELSGVIKRTMETAFDRVRVRGELGRVTIAKSGHLYADLKDDSAVLNMVMWKGQASGLKFRPEEGLEVIAEGRLTTYPGKSSYQLIADRMEPAGVGALLAQLERLKARLAGEGLFAPERKKPIPFLPTTIGVITSPTGAVIRDILHRLGERFPRRVLLWPVLVQGEQAAGQVAAAIKGFNALSGDLRPDVLIVARGGGSIEDLWAFNEEIVVRAAAESVIPLISAVGHETDTTLIDYVSDLRAPTPTGAAEKAVPVRAELLERTATLGGRLGGGLARGLERRRVELRAAAGRLPRPEQLLGLAQQRFDRAAERLALGLMANARAASAKFERTAARLRPEALTQDLARKHARAVELGHRQHMAQARISARAGERLQIAVGRLGPALQRQVSAKAGGLSSAARLLDTLSHKSVLARGFALVTRPDGALVRAASDLAPGDGVHLAFADGARAAVIGAEALLRAPAPPQGPKPEPPPRKRRTGGDDPPGGDQGSLF
jgi:exodeoxyribonuclease VII large subunit